MEEIIWNPLFDVYENGLKILLIHFQHFWGAPLNWSTEYWFNRDVTEVSLWLCISEISGPDCTIVYNWGTPNDDSHSILKVKEWGIWRLKHKNKSNLEQFFWLLQFIQFSKRWLMQNMVKSMENLNNWFKIFLWK